MIKTEIRRAELKKDDFDSSAISANKRINILKQISQSYNKSKFQAFNPQIKKTKKEEPKNDILSITTSEDENENRSQVEDMSSKDDKEEFFEKE